MSKKRNTFLPLFKSFKAPKASATLTISKDNFNLGETINGELLVTSQEDFEADEIRVELVGIEKIQVGGEPIRGMSETQETRLYSSSTPQTQTGTIREYLMYRGQTKISQKLSIPNGYNQQFSFNITVPAGLGPTFTGLRRD